MTIQVLSCDGSGSLTSVISGMNKVLQLAQNHVGTPAVLVMSLGGGFSQAENNAVANLHTNGMSGCASLLERTHSECAQWKLANAPMALHTGSAVSDARLCDRSRTGVSVVVAAGNDYRVDACTKSPASAPDAITVGATTSSDALASYSNVRAAHRCTSVYHVSSHHHGCRLPQTAPLAAYVGRAVCRHLRSRFRRRCGRPCGRHRNHHHVRHVDGCAARCRRGRPVARRKPIVVAKHRQPRLGMHGDSRGCLGLLDLWRRRYAQQVLVCGGSTFKRPRGVQIPAESALPTATASWVQRAVHLVQ